MMTKIFYSIGSFFESIFEFMPLFGDYINYFNILIISLFLIVWINKMVGFKKRGEEHGSL